MFSTAKDLAKLLMCYLNHGQIDMGKRLFGESEIAEIAPDSRRKVEGARRFGWVFWDAHMSDAAFGGVLLHSGWSGQTLFLDLKKGMYGIVLTTRCGVYGRAKRDRFTILNRIWASV